MKSLFWLFNLFIKAKKLVVRELLGKNFRIYGTKENPLFLAKDVANWIEHSQVSKIILTVDEDEKVRNIVPTIGGNQEMWVLTKMIKV